ncbi:cyclic lactone autoinducer peptide [Anaerosolibacter sp.]
MKNKVFMTLTVLGASLLTFFATTTSASACLWGWYQPSEPKLLKDK